MNILRPDELAANSQIRRNIEQGQSAKKGIKTAIGLGGSFIGAGLASKVLPFLSEFIPADLALKGINKVAPEIGKFLKKGQSMGLNLKEGFNFIKENIQPKKEEQSQENPVVKQAKDFETNYPEITRHIANHIQNGRSPQEAAAIIKVAPYHKKQVKKIEKETGKNFVDFIVEMMGGNQSSQMQQPQQMQQQAPQGTPGTQQQQPQINNDQAIMSALEKILKM